MKEWTSPESGRIDVIVSELPTAAVYRHHEISMPNPH
jgi:hypothetical protein